MLTENINIETQVQVDITRAALQTLIADNEVKKKLYHVTDAMGGTQKILVWSLTNSTTSFNAVNFTNGKFGRYYIGPDVFVAIVEGMGGVLSYNSFAVFPTTRLQNTVYIDLSTNEQYYWNGSSYELLSGGNVYEPTVDDFPTIGSVDTLYVATETGVMYLWDGTDEVYVALSDNGNYIPLAGTEFGSPVTGTIEAAVNVILARLNGIIEYGVSDDLTLAGSRYSKNSHRTHPTGQAYNKMRLKSASYEGIFQWLANTATNRPQLLAGGDNPLFEGIIYDSDYSANFTLRSLIDQKVIKSRIWTIAGTPKKSDDSAAGYLVGSLIWDTTNSILYKCTNNTVGAATWVNAIQSASYENITGTSVTNAITLTSGTTRYVPMVFSGNFGTSTNASWVATRYAKGGVLSGAALYMNSTNGNAQFTATLQKGSSPSTMADTSIVITVAANAAAGQFTSANTVTVSDGEYLCWKLVMASGATSGIVEQLSCVLAH